MSWNRNTFLWLLLGLGSVGALLTREAGTVVGGEGGDPEAAEPETPVAVEAGELWAHPARYIGREVRFKIRFKDWLADWNPYLTRFGAAEYRAFIGWGERAFPWERAHYEAPRARAFLRRGDAPEWALEDAERYDSFEIVGRVRAVFATEPWIEVTGVVPVLITIPEGTVLHAARAVDLMADESWGRAEDELERALAAPLPDVAREELRRLQEQCRAAAEAATDPLERARREARALSRKNDR